MSESPFAAILRPELAELSSYLPHAGRYPVRLDANEAPALLSDAARRRLTEALTSTAWERYPDPRATELRAAIAEHLGVSPERLLIGTGSDEVIALLLTALDRSRRPGHPAAILTPTPTFVMYRLSARARGMRCVEVPLDASWDLDERGMLRAIEFAQPNVVFIATPNNPTGTEMSRARIEAVIEAAKDALVVIDEAYVDYADRSNLDLVDRYPNVAILRTLSKIGFAALRVGWLVGPEGLVREVDKVRQPYNLPVPSQVLATFVLRELSDEVRGMVAKVKAERQRLTEAIAGLPGFSVSPSQANFLWVRTPEPAEVVHRRLAEQGVLVRSFHAVGGRLGHQLRITVGSPSENDRLLEALGRCG